MYVSMVTCCLFPWIPVAKIAYGECQSVFLLDPRQPCCICIKRWIGFFKKAGLMKFAVKNVVKFQCSQTVFAKQRLVTVTVSMVTCF